MHFAHRVGVLGGVGLVSVSPSTLVKSRGGSPGTSAFVNTSGGKPYTALTSTLCFRWIGSSNWFCMVDKVPFYLHCGIPAHGKGIQRFQEVQGRG
jgi:hypothetical protein